MVTPKPILWNEVQRKHAAFITLGNFDGVHLGHARVLQRLIEEARSLNLDPVVVTFEPHPRHYFRPDDPCHLLTSPREKSELLASYPVEVITLVFDAELAALSAENFIQHFLLYRLQGQRFMLGHDHQFGAKAAGNASLLRSRVPNGQEAVQEIAPYSMAGEVVSSSAIRTHLEAGELKSANHLLGRPFAYDGTVIHGLGRARTLDVPTANIETGCKEKVRVAAGVYFGNAQLASGVTYPALANIGFSPTFGSGDHKIEVHIPGFNGDLYGQRLRFKLDQRHREERRFSDISALKTQILEDLMAFERISGPP